MKRQQRKARARCIQDGHKWAISAPFSHLLLMGRVRCRSCGRYNWLTDELIESGRRQRKVATGYQEWTAERIRYRVSA